MWSRVSLQVYRGMLLSRLSLFLLRSLRRCIPIEYAESVGAENKVWRAFLELYICLRRYIHMTAQAGAACHGYYGYTLSLFSYCFVFFQKRRRNSFCYCHFFFFLFFYPLFPLFMIFFNACFFCFKLCFFLI